MNIKKLCEDAHKNAVEKGFYDCPECDGRGTVESNRIDSDKTCDVDVCNMCDGSGINPNRNIGELLALICSELYKALEAHRCGKFAELKRYNAFKEIDSSACNRVFGQDIKDTFEDEIADVFIRLFDLCGYLGIVPENFPHSIDCPENISTAILNINLMIINLMGQIRGLLVANFVYDILDHLLFLCNRYKIDIKKHIALKMAYNKTRPRKHGKKY